MPFLRILYSSAANHADHPGGTNSWQNFVILCVSKNSNAIFSDKARLMIPNVLAERYASKAVTEIWSAEGRVKLEREFWIAVMKAQQSLGLDIPDTAIADYEKVIDKINLESIAERERVTRHDVKARIEEFNDLAGHEHIHKGMTSRDLTENVEQLQIYRSLLSLIHI